MKDFRALQSLALDLAHLPTDDLRDVVRAAANCHDLDVLFCTRTPASYSSFVRCECDSERPVTYEARTTTVEAMAPAFGRTKTRIAYWLQGWEYGVYLVIGLAVIFALAMLGGSR